jgi:Flp pilus assembly protein TadG
MLKLRGQGGRERGQALIIITLAMPLFLSVVALVVDGSLLLVHRRSLQVAADAASLAAAQEITTDFCDLTCQPGLQDRVEHKAGEYSDKNGGPSEPDVNGVPILPLCSSPSEANCVAVKPSLSTPRQVEVRLTRSNSTFFTRAVGLKNLFDVSARAVAGTNFATSITPPTVSESTRTGTTVPDSFSTSTGTVTIGIPGSGSGIAFAKSTACPAISYTGTAKGARMGSFATNGGVRIGGNNDKTIDYLAIGRLGETVNGRPCYDNQAGATVNQVIGPFAPMDWPLPLPAVPTPGSGCTSLNPVVNVTQKARTANVATLTTSTALALAVGDSVVVAGVDPSFNGTFVVSAVNGSSFSYASNGPDVAQTSSGGTVTGPSAGISGGWQTTHAPGVYCLTDLRAQPVGRAGVLTLSNVTLNGGAGYTLFAPCLSVSGGTYTHYAPPSGPAPSPPTLFYASATDSSCPSGSALTIQGQGATIDGDIFAPNGDVSLQGGGVSAGRGFIESQTIGIQGNSANFQGTGPIVSGTTTTTTTSTITIPGFTDPGTTVTTTIPGTTSTTSTDYGLDE